jgi:monofunctional glycosyltransferase
MKPVKSVRLSYTARSPNRGRLLRALALLALAFLALQLYFTARIVALRWVAPESTAFQRSEAYRVAALPTRFAWRQIWSDDSGIADHLKRAVIASEDSSFVDHAGVDWDAIEKAWQRNERASAKASAQGDSPAKPGTRLAKVIGGSTITQQLAKNLFLSGERTTLRKLQELVIALQLDAFVPKARLLEVYLNSVEWGEGVFGAQSASMRYFKKNAAQLNAREAARLAVMLPAPKRFEKTPNSAYLASRTAVIVARMGDVELP